MVFFAMCRHNGDDKELDVVSIDCDAKVDGHRPPNLKDIDDGSLHSVSISLDCGRGVRSAVFIGSGQASRCWASTSFK